MAGKRSFSKNLNQGELADVLGLKESQTISLFVNKLYR